MTEKNSDIKIAIAQLNPYAGVIKKNSDKMLKCIQKAQSLGINILVFPENTLLGCKMEDTVTKFPFLYEKGLEELNKLAEETKDITVFTLYTDRFGKQVLASLRNGVLRTDYEKRSIVQYKENLFCFSLNKISEYRISENENSQFDVLFFFDNIGIVQDELYTKTEKLKQLAKSLKIPVINTSATGGTDSFVLSGGSCIIDREGNIISLAKQYQEDFLIFNPFKKSNEHIALRHIEQKEEFSLDYEADLERTYNVLIYGIKEYFTKCGLQRAVLGLSGGLDSTVCAVLLADALGKENVLGVSMPSKLTSRESLSDAKILAQNLGIKFVEMPIKLMYETTKECLNTLFSDVEKFWDNRYQTSYTSDNIQARSRAMYLWGISNEFSSCIPIATSDKSEAYMGYATINGDMSGGFAPILDITKTKLFALARWMNKNRAEKNVIPQSVINKKPGAELAIDPKTGKTLNAEDALMPYEFMDEVIWRIEKKQETYNQMMDSVFEYEKKYSLTKVQKQAWLDKFFRRMSCALYKSYIMPPSIITDYPSNIKTVYYQPVTSGGIDYKYC